MTNQQGLISQSWYRRGLAALIVATCVRVWIGPNGFEPVALAQIPDSGLQRKQLIEETQRSNQLLADILTVLRSQTLKVRLESTDKTPAAPAGR